MPAHVNEHARARTLEISHGRRVPRYPRIGKMGVCVVQQAGLTTRPDDRLRYVAARRGRNKSSGGP